MMSIMYKPPTTRGHGKEAVPDSQGKDAFRDRATGRPGGRRSVSGMARQSDDAESRGAD